MLTTTDAQALDGLVAERRARLQTRLADAPFDLLLLTTPESVLYATGFRSVSAAVFGDYAIMAVVAPDALTLVLGASDVAAALDSGVVEEELVAYGTFYFEGDHAGGRFAGQHPDPRAALATALSRRAGSTSVLGVESPTRIAGIASELLEGAVDATDWMMVVRAVKLPTEQELLREAVVIAEAGIRAGLGAIVPGATERDVANAVSAAMAARGGIPRFLVVTSGERSALSDAFASDRKLQLGDLVRFDIGCIHHGYWSDIARTAVIGEPDPRQAAYFEAIRVGLAQEIDHVAVGLGAGQLFDIGVEAVRSLGISHYRRHHVGHAIGLAVYERPVIGPGVPTRLEEGMVLCLETPYYELGWGGMMVEDSGVVRDDGFEFFTSLDRGLFVVPD